MKKKSGNAAGFSAKGVGIVLYIIGQMFGLLATVCCFIGPFWKTKQQMLINSIAANLFTAFNFFLIGEVGSAIFLNAVAIVQMFFSMYHLNKNTKVTAVENVVFLILYITCGIMGYAKSLDILPIIGSVLFMIGVFEKSPQISRKWSLANASIWLVYDIAVGAAAALSQVFSIIAIIFALYKYRRKSDKQKA